MAVLAASLAFGRVRGFWPVLEALDQQARDHGGPHAWLLGLDEPGARPLLALRHRWLTGEDLALWCRVLGRALRAHGRLGAIAEAAFRPEHEDIGEALDGLVGALRALAGQEAGGRPFEELPRSFRTLLCRPSEGSACKRWCMALRWLCRPAGDPARADGLDLGLWRLPPARLVIPLDTHIGRLSWFLGLSERADGTWRTARRITAALARLDPGDPLRFDYALAHLGIDGRCTVRPGSGPPPDPEVCLTCPLGPVCRVNPFSPRQEQER